MLISCKNIAWSSCVMETRAHKQTHPAIYKDGGFKKLSIEQIDDVFIDHQSDSPRRKLLAAHLRLFIQKLQSLGVTGELWIDGSFSTKNPNPSDIDVLLVISESTLEKMSDANYEELDTLADDRQYVRTRWNCDFYVVESSDIGSRKYYEDWFSRNPDEFNRKGIPVINL